MVDERIFTVRKMANKLFSVENAIDRALSEAAELAAQLPQARQDLKLSAVVGQDVFDRTVDVIAALTAARRNAVELHGRMNDTKDELGLRTVAFGHMYIKPTASGTAAPALRAVGNQAA